MSKIRYVPTSGSDVAESLSQVLWRLSCPESPDKSTVRVFDCVTCLDGSVWLEVVTDYAVPVHADAVLGDALADILQPWITDGLLPETTLQDLAAVVIAHRDQRLVLWEAFPALFHTQSRTKDELMADGLLPQISI